MRPFAVVLFIIAGSAVKDVKFKMCFEPDQQAEFLLLQDSLSCAYDGVATIYLTDKVAH